MQIEGAGKTMACPDKVFQQRSPVSHGHSAWTPWLLCKLKSHFLEKPVGSLQGRLKIIAAICKLIKKKKFFALRIRILCDPCVRALTLFPFLASELYSFDIKL